MVYANFTLFIYLFNLFYLFIIYPSIYLSIMQKPQRSEQYTNAQQNCMHESHSTLSLDQLGCVF